MNNFLHCLYRLSQSSKRTPREDFLSLCVGRQLEADADFAAALLKTIAKLVQNKSLTKSIKQWRRAPDGARSLEVRAQVPARTQQHERDGAVDLLLRLDGPSKVELIIEAKVGASVPESAQLERYAAAFPEATEGLSKAKVIGLIQKTESHRYPPGWNHITWDDVMASIPTVDTRDLLSRSRRELSDLLAEGRVGDTRLALPPTAWSEVVTATQVYEKKLPPKLHSMMVAMFPNDELRQRASEMLKDEDAEVECTNAWGLGFWVNHVPRGMRIQGLTLGLEDGPFHDEVIWRLEICPTNETLRAWLRSEDAPSWWPVRSETGWFFTHLTTTSGERNLNKADLGEVVRLGRIALKAVHAQTDEPWHPHGDGRPPYAPRELYIPTLRDGIRQWEMVYQGLEQVVLDLLTILGPQGCDKTAYRWHEDAWRSKDFLGTIESYVRGAVEYNLKSLYVEVTDPTDVARARIQAAVESQEIQARLPVLYDPDRCRLTWHIDAATWQDPTVAPTLAGILRAGLEA